MVFFLGGDGYNRKKGGGRRRRKKRKKIKTKKNKRNENFLMVGGAQSCGLKHFSEPPRFEPFGSLGGLKELQDKGV
jgi:hypothetical protein